ncbi:MULTISPECIES: hybrid sensor histidine kinase/response regulator [Citrobacter]|uniref:hybrid sensor histidine kinase/response regulator n=1 Tax=Citrobacter TaxID=544 RepID=UPI000846C490|nr:MULTISPECIES: hybrid sensor histidine kinase/response regulator [Citrobacter]MBQ4926094.1 hybrid sensor histidine kinase/response regulator [Citrobacter werkmanii]MBQ4938170.1 hybrid sensor histidine kinase/response regulator [Citrobacter werkmanii]MBQ4950947.1 hybrid sensor histidine kinase/response regulator [Citrobacter werkmanii]MBQ4967120.1 hybrid sensor histidine kinase/response regulator [Citrobacter werkmanii]MDM3293151.1 ATP-binding protein [Citrobacter sp. Cc139]
MPQPGRHFFASARGRLLFFNLLVVAVTLMVSGVAVLGFQHASQIQEQVQQQTVDDMTGSMNLARDTANVATAAVRLSQVVGALEYKGEAERLQETQRALKHSLQQLAGAPLAQQEPVLVERIIQRSNELQSSVEGMLQRGQRRHLERNALLSSLYQNQSYLRHLQTLTGAQDDMLLGQIDRLIVAAIETPTPRSVVKQLDSVMTALPLHHSSPLISRILNDFNQELHKLEPLSSALEQSDLAINWYMFHIKALVAILNSDINQYASQVALISEQRVAQSHQELQSGALFIMVFALLAVVITGFAGWYIYRNLGSNLTAISQAMTRLAHGESDVSVPALQRRDELGELARAFSVFARNTASLEHTTRLLKEKTSQMEIDRTERQELEEALLHSQKLKAVGQLTGGLAHDFNNLLAVIIGSLDLVNPDSPDAPRVNRALKAAERGALLTQRLLAFSRKQSLHPHAVELKTLLENLGELMRHSLPATLTLEIEAQSPAWPAWIDVSQLENAIINLVMNARDAMDGQAGTIKIRTWNQRVTRSDGRKQDMVMLEVADQGCGMSQEVKAQVFEPFFTTKQTGSGSGLGLSMVYGFVRQSGGRVEIESAPGQGTTVRLQLPRAVVPVQAEAEPIAEHAANSGEKLVLVLEDEADVRQTLCEQLHLLGYLTLEAANGEQAMHMLTASSEIDIFISDVMLPGGLSGVDVVNHAQAHYPQLNILLMSGQDLRPAHNPALPDVALLRKPFTRTELAQALRHSRN